MGRRRVRSAGAVIDRRLVLALASVAVVISGCGSSANSNGEASKPPEQVLSDASTALRQVHSLRVSGMVTVDKLPTAVTLAVKPPSDLSIAMTQGASSAQMILLASSVYIKMSPEFARRQANVPAPTAALISNRWLKVPPSAVGGAASLTKQFNLDTLSRCVVENHGSLTRGGTATVNGQPAVVIVDKGDKPGSTPSRLYVATTGPPLPLRAVATGRQRPGGASDAQCNNGGDPTRPGEVLTFTDYNKSLNIAPPAGAVDLSQLTGG